MTFRDPEKVKGSIVRQRSIVENRGAVGRGFLVLFYKKKPQAVFALTQAEAEASVERSDP